MEIEIGASKRARRAYAFDDIAIVPSRRTRDPRGRVGRWSIDAYQFDIPFLAAPMDSVVSPTTAIMMGKLGGLGVLDLEGLWTRYEDPEPLLAEIRALPDERATARMQEIYSEPIKPELVTARLAEIRAAGVTVAGALSPAAHPGALRDRRRRRRRPLRHPRHHRLGRARLQEPGAAQPQEVHLRTRRARSSSAAPPTYTAALHLMRTGAAGVLVGFGGGAASTTRATLGIHAPMATAVADVAGARRDYMDESGGRYVHVIADGGLGTSGDIVKAIALRRRRRHARLHPRPGDGCPRRRLPLGRRGAPLRSCRAAAGSRSARSRRSRRSSTARRPSPTARPTSSARCAARWRPPDTPTSRNSSGSRSSSRRTLHALSLPVGRDLQDGSSRAQGRCDCPSRALASRQMRWRSLSVPPRAAVRES